MAAGPGIRPRAGGAPCWSGRSARNYAHLLAERLKLDLVDVTFSGATTAHVLADHQRGEPPQIAGLDGSESLVTVTIGGNDVGYVPLLMAASLPRCVRRPATGCEIVGAAAASRQHHAWSAEPWTTTPARYGVPLPGRPAPLHPNAAGMAAVAELLVAQR